MDINIDSLIKRIENRVAKPIDINRKFAVLLPLYWDEKDKQWNIIYQVRANNLKSQPGEISFPGGRVEKGETFRHAAVRETMEELLIERENIQVIGELDYIVTTGNLIIRCFLGIIKDIDFQDIEPSKDEVDHLFKVPLNYFMENAPLSHNVPLVVELNDDFPYHLIPNGKDYPFAKGTNNILFYDYQGYNIWGFTAKMTSEFINIVKGMI